MRGLAMLIGVAIGVGIVSFMVSLSKDRLRMVLVGEFAVAEVIQVEQKQRRSRRRSYTSYSAAVQHEAGTSYISSDAELSPGDRVKIIYDATNPKRAELSNGSYSLIGGSNSAVMDATFYLAGLFLLISCSVGARSHFRNAYRGRGTG